VPELFPGIVRLHISAGLSDQFSVQLHGLAAAGLRSICLPLEDSFCPSLLLKWLHEPRPAMAGEMEVTLSTQTSLDLDCFVKALLQVCWP
jgi:hypothetical protein